MNEVSDTGYRVLARKYRPAGFSDLIGQDVLVETLRNAFESDRIAHAFLMTGVRGVGKTTTARIIAKGLNCTGAEGGGPTVEPCNACDACRSIAESRHVDVIEMDAASRTGVDDIREVIEGAQYRATSARYKIYIIDEVHMLSRNAFNALLKTLEEPPDHVKFIFATTEVQKLPVTVLSRCQRYDLRRIEPEVMVAHLGKIAGLEGVEVADDALALIARAAEGSVRDAQSILDQAIAHDAGRTTVGQVRAMLGLADSGRAMDLFDLVTRGDAAGALAEMAAQFESGAEPLAILREVSEVVHRVSVLKVSPELARDPSVTPEQRDRGMAAAGNMSLRVLGRLWQMMLKALREVADAPNPRTAAEMAVIRMTHVCDLPTPEELIRTLRSERAAAGGAGPSGASTAPAGNGAHPPAGAAGAGKSALPPDNGTTRAPEPTRDSVVPPFMSSGELEAPAPELLEFGDVVELARAQRDLKLVMELETHVRLVSFARGRIEFEPAEGAPSNLPARLERLIKESTGERWQVEVGADGGPTVRDERKRRDSELRELAMEHPMVRAALDAFPGARIEAVRTGAGTSGSERRADGAEAGGHVGGTGATF